jgi:hypothetical protein
MLESFSRKLGRAIVLTVALAARHVAGTTRSMLVALFEDGVKAGRPACNP